jgi:predicted ATPase
MRTATAQLHIAAHERRPSACRIVADPVVDRLRLLSAVLDFLRGIGAKHPLLLVLEDLHDADRGTLDLLVYLAAIVAVLDGQPD